MSEIDNWNYLLKLMDQYFEERQMEIEIQKKELKLPERGQRVKKNKKKKKPKKKEKVDE